MNLIIKINLDNEAFEDSPMVLKRILTQAYLLLATSPRGLLLERSLRDSNGSTVGTVEVTE